MSPTPSNSDTSSKLISIAPELRNRIYEYVLAEVEGKVGIRMLKGPNASRQERERKAAERKRLPSTISPLAQLLTCRQINSEASPMAYSKMSIVYETVPVPTHLRPRSSMPGGQGVIAATLLYVFDNLLKVFGYPKLHLIAHLYWIDDLYELVELESLVAESTFHAPCHHHAALGPSHSETQKGVVLAPTSVKPAQDLFRNVVRMTIVDELYAGRPTQLKPGASWLSLHLQDQDEEERLCYVFPNLQEIVLQLAGGELCCNRTREDLRSGINDASRRI